jgi:DNA-binding response OmpR family regulator
MPKKHLLVIDDEPDFGAMVGTVGKRLGYEVTVTSLAKDFQAAFADHRPETVVLDIVMPDMDGMELIQWLIDRDYDGHLIVVSGFSPDYVKLAKRLAIAKNGMFKVEALTKPVPLATLRDALSD